jgi:hypothetical protein
MMKLMHFCSIHLDGDGTTTFLRKRSTVHPERTSDPENTFQSQMSLEVPSTRQINLHFIKLKVNRLSLIKIEGANLIQQC